MKAKKANIGHGSFPKIPFSRSKNMGVIKVIMAANINEYWRQMIDQGPDFIGKNFRNKSVTAPGRLHVKQ
jgi:hypothetical protein